MPVRTKDGLVHRVAAREGVDYKGILGCGMLYRRDAKSRTKWVPHGVPTMSGPREVIAIRTSKTPTCLWCVAGRER